MGSRHVSLPVLLLVLLTGLVPATGVASDITVVRVSGESPFPIGDCRPADEPFVGANRGGEGDPSIAINPTDPDNIVAAWTQDALYGFVAASSFDGGTTWTRTVVPGFTTCTGGSEDHVAHARLSFGADGRLYLAGETLGGYFPDPRSGINHVPVATSTDGGLTWTAPVRVDDQPALNGFDRIAAKPDQAGAAVVVWHGPETAASSFLSRTTDGGATWSKHPLPIPTEFQPFLGVLPTSDGAIHAFYTEGTLLATVGILAAIIGIPVSFATDLYTVRSDDDGATWTSPVLVAEGVQAEWVGAVEGTEGRVVVSSWRAGEGGHDLFVTRSDDRGASWSAEMLVASGAQAPFPVLAGRADGSMGITYNTVATEGRTIWFARSADDGETWTHQPVAGPVATGADGFYQETAAGPDGFASVFIRRGPDTDGPTDVYVALVPD